jgi:hypothetical protein
MRSPDTIGYPDAPTLALPGNAEPQEAIPDSQLETAEPENLLNSAEVLELSSLEATVERGLRAFWEMGQALRQIRDKRLYRQDYSTFEDYCISRWEMSRRSADQLIGAATVYENFERHGAQILPANERQTRPLVPLPPEQQREAWTRAISTAPNGRVTSTHVAKVVKEYQQNGLDAASTSKNAPRSQQKPGAAQPDAGEPGTNSRSCWNCYHCSLEWIKDDPHSFYCYRFGKLNFLEKDGNERGAECELWTYRWTEEESVKNTTFTTQEIFTLTLQLSANLRSHLQDAAKAEGLAVVDWAAKVLEAAVSTSTSADATPTRDSVANACGDSKRTAIDCIEVSVSKVSEVSEVDKTDATDGFAEQIAA